MGAFRDYMSARVLKDNPQLMQEYLADRRAAEFAQQTPYVMGQPAQYGEETTTSPYQLGEEEWMQGEEMAPPTGLMEDTQTVMTQGPTGLFDDTMPMDKRLMGMTSRAGQSGVPAYQDMAINNLQQRNQAIAGGSNPLGFGAARRMIQDEAGDQFWVGNVTNKNTGVMETVYSPIGHSKTAPEGQVELIDEMGNTPQEKLDWKVREKQLMAQTDQDVGFYLEYPSAMQVSEDAVYDIEYTMRDAAELYGVTDHSTAGFGSWISGIPLTGATDWRELKSTVQSRLALTKMMLLKAASSTGSTGFGALSEKELKILTDNLASLEQRKSPAAIKKSLVKILADLERSRTRLKQAAIDDRKKYIRLHGRFKGENSPFTEKVQRRMDNEAGQERKAGTTKSGIQYTVGDD